MTEAAGDARASDIARALQGVGLCALPDRRGRACVDVYAAWGEVDPFGIVAYFDLEPFEALDDRGIAQEILRQMAESYLKL